MIRENTFGAEWRRWDLHVHTKGTHKNDQFTSLDFDTFCTQLFKKAFENKIAVIGITDYFTIDNYNKVSNFQKDIINNSSFSTEEKQSIQKILLLPNVELRMLPVTCSGQLVNIHCIFNPSYVEKLEQDFFINLLVMGRIFQ